MRISMGKKLTLLLISLVWIIPLYLLIITPFKSNADVFSNTFALPNFLNFKNFMEAWTQTNVPLFLKNSLLITGLSMLLLVLITVLSSYAIHRSKTRVSKWIFTLILFGLMVPTQVGMIPLYLLLKQMNLLNSIQGLVLAYTALFIPVSSFIIVGFFRGIPKEIVEAANMDGCNERQLLQSIYLPISRGPIASVLIYVLVQIWNDLLYPLLFTMGDTWKTMALGVYNLKGQYMTNYPILFAGMLFSIIPVLLIFLFMQKQFIEGMTAGAVKG